MGQTYLSFGNSFNILVHFKVSQIQSNPPHNQNHKVALVVCLLYLIHDILFYLVQNRTGRPILNSDSLYGW